MRLRAKEETARISIPRSADRPASKNRGKSRHILLRIAAIHAQRMQLHNLAGEVFVQAFITPLPGAGIRAD